MFLLTRVCSNRYVGTIEGIFVLHLNYQDRKFMPALEPR